MEWLTDLTIWVGLLTLVVLEIILGIDNPKAIHEGASILDTLDRFKPCLSG